MCDVEKWDYFVVSVWACSKLGYIVHYPLLEMSICALFLHMGFMGWIFRRCIVVMINSLYGWSCWEDGRLMWLQIMWRLLRLSVKM
jgi:hypothetical protein